MPNIFFNNNFNRIFSNKDIKPLSLDINKNNINYTRHFPPANQEWFNSIYAYKKNFLRHLPVVDKMIIRLIKSYFNLFNPRDEKKISSIKLRIRSRRLSINRIFVSKAELKHTSSKVIITLYIYNRQKKYFFNKLKKINTIEQLYDINFIKKVKLQSLNIIKQVNKEKKLLADIYSFENYEKSQCENFIRKSFQKEMLKLFYKNLLHFNKSKFENTFLIKLNFLISKIYKKKVEFNIVDLKYLHLNSDILSESIVLKLRNRNNRLLRVLKTSMNMIKLPFINKLSINYNLNNIRLNKTLFLNSIQNFSILLENLSKKYPDKDKLDQILKKIFPFFSNKENDIKNVILNCIKHKSISGIRLEASGRLSRRLTAARSVFKFKYKGSLKNIDSSYKGLSSVILRGHMKSNVQYTNINSKTRNGSFGIKGWISSV